MVLGSKGAHYFGDFSLKILRARISLLLCRRLNNTYRMHDESKEENMAKHLNQALKYGWWKKSCTSWYGKYPIIYKVTYMSGGVGFLPM